MLAPLRKIVDRGRNAAGTNTEMLSCGHVIHERHDHMGATNAERRRCKECLKVAARWEALKALARISEDSNPAKSSPTESRRFQPQSGK